MRRRMMGQRKVTYHIDCDYLADRGNLRVIVDNMYVGDVVNGVCEWESKPYKKDVVVTIENAIQKKEESEYYTQGCAYRERHESNISRALFPGQTVYFPYDYSVYTYFVDILVKRTAIYTPNSATIRVGVYNISLYYEKPAVTVVPVMKSGGGLDYKNGNYSISSIYPNDGNVQKQNNYTLLFSYIQTGLAYSISINNYSSYYHFNFASR